MKKSEAKRIAAGCPRGFSREDIAWRLCNPVDPETTIGLLELVDVTITPETLKTWTPLMIAEAEEWAGRTHLRASDNIVRVPPRPDFLPNP